MKIPTSLPTDRPVRIVTHSGSFHTDELLAVATLELYLERNGYTYELFRTRDIEIIKVGDVVCDIGEILDPETFRFDHHQREGAGSREGIPYSSFGLIWKHFGLALCEGNEIVWRNIERAVVYPVDAADNGVSVYDPVIHGVHPFLFHHIIFAFHPTWKEKEIGIDTDERFAELLTLCKRFMEREIIMMRDNEEGRQLVQEYFQSAEDKRLIILNQNLAWEDELSRHEEPMFAIYPSETSSEESSWRLKAVRSDPKSFESRKPLPESWRGLTGEELEIASGVKGATFCHRGGFLAIAQTKSAALALAAIALI